MKQFTEILKKSKSNLTAQINAAETLQMWGESTKRSKLYVEAMMGREKVKQPKSARSTNLIWGWRKLVTVTKGKDKFKSVFTKSLFKLIEARLEYGLLEKSDKAIASALTELTNARRRNPEMGGPNWKKKYDALEARIRQKK